MNDEVKTVAVIDHSSRAVMAQQLVAAVLGGYLHEWQRKALDDEYGVLRQIQKDGSGFTDKVSYPVHVVEHESELVSNDEWIGEIAKTGTYGGVRVDYVIVDSMSQLSEEYCRMVVDAAGARKKAVVADSSWIGEVWIDGNRKKRRAGHYNDKPGHVSKYHVGRVSHVVAT